MYLIIWEYRVKADRVNDFERVYNPGGAWAELFKKSRGYLGTELLRDEENLQRCVTIDRWDTKEDYESFLSQWEKEYKALDAQCEGLTESESCLGKWVSAR